MMRNAGKLRLRSVLNAVGTRATLCLLVGTLAVALSGCGGSDSEEGVPAELVGTYTTTLQASDLPRPNQPEFVDGGLEWKMTIATSGGPDGGPVLALRSTEQGALEGPTLSVDGDRLLLKKEECAQETGYVFYDNEYSWKLDGSTLTLTTVKNQCPDRVAETILASRPWAKR
jgi:hypothetical protein